MRSVKDLLVICVLLLSPVNGIGELRLTAETESLASVHGCVNVLSGDFFLARPDLVIPGPTPQHYTSCYDSGHVFYNGDRGFGMGCQFPLLLQDMQIHNKKPGNTTLNLSEREGFLIPYKGQFIHQAIKLSVDPTLFDYGYTNYSEGDISGRNNIKNRSIIYSNFKKHYRWGTFEITEGSGTKRYYSPFNHGGSWRLVKEIKPNGHIVHFDYWGDWLLKSVRTTNAAETITYNNLEFYADGSGYRVIGSNNQHARYTLQQFDRWLAGVKHWTTHLTGVDPSHGIATSYVIADSIHQGIFGQIEQVVRPDGRFLKIAYGPTSGRVLALLAPVGQDQTPIRIASFQYQKDKTEVFDAHENKTIYRNQQHRISAIERYAKDGSLYSTQHFTWAESGSDKGNLLAKGLSQGMDSFVQYIVGSYDSSGNIIKEELFGNLTGKGATLFTLQNGKPTQETESYSTLFRYSNDGFNVPLEEIHPDGTKISFKYLPGTNLCTAKLTQDSTQVLSREFNLYDDGLLAATITDDGTGQEVDDLTDVTVRRITRIFRRLEKPAVGYPQSVLETYVDLSSREERQLKRTEYLYDRFDNLIREEIYDANDSYCYNLQYTYDDKGNLTSRTDALAQCTRYGYDANKNRIFEFLEGSGFCTHYDYDYVDRLIQTKEVHDDGTIVTTKHSYDYLGNRIRSVDHRGHETQYTYDEFGRLVSVTDPTSAQTKKEYNVLGQCISETDANGAITRTSANVRGQPTAIFYSDGSSERFEYHLNGTLAKKWEKTGLCHHYTYDGLKRLILSECYDPNGTLLETNRNDYRGANLHRTIDPKGYVTEYAYDGAGRKTQEVRGDETGVSRTTYHYDALGRLTTIKQWINEIDFTSRTTEFDFLDRLVETRTEDAQGRLLRKERYAYNVHGDRTHTYTYDTENSYSVTKTRYDLRRRPIEQIDALGYSTHIHYDDRYGAQRVLRKITTDPLKNQVIELHDPLERVVSIERRNAAGVRRAYQEIGYDLKGQKINQRDYILSGGEYRVEWQFDSMGRMIVLTEAGTDGLRTLDPALGREGIGVRPICPLFLKHLVETQEDSLRTSWATTRNATHCLDYWDHANSAGSRVLGLQKVTRFTYNAAGQLKELTKPDGTTLEHRYDLFGRLIELTSSDQTIAYSYCYDANHNLTCSIDHIANTTTERSHDAWNRVLTEQLGNGLLLRYRYDALGRLLTVTLPNQACIHYTYDAVNLLAVSRFDHSGVLYEHRYVQHNLKGQEQGHVLIGNAGLVNLDWDRLGRLVHIETPSWTQTIPPEGFDGVGNLLNLEMTDPLGQVFSSYAYDDLYQLIRETGLASHSYAYDSIQNRTQKDQLPYTINGLNQVVSDTTVTYGYDLNGNLIDKAGRCFTYDALNRLLSVEEPTEWKVCYTYDSFGRRLTRTLHRWDEGWIVENSIAFVHQHQREIGNCQQGKFVELRVLGYGKGGDLGAAVALELDGQIYAPIHDHRGNVCCLLDSETGHVKECYRYSSYGEEAHNGQHSNSSVINPWRFASKRIDEHTGLIQFGKRDYDSNLGRWLTPDPLGFVDGPNLYAYVHNRPMTLFDPFGLASQNLYERNRAGVSAGSRGRTDSYCGNRSAGCHDPNPTRAGCCDHNSKSYGSSWIDNAIWGYQGLKDSWRTWERDQRTDFVLENVQDSATIISAIPFCRAVSGPVRVVAQLGRNLLQRSPQKGMPAQIAARAPNSAMVRKVEGAAGNVLQESRDLSKLEGYSVDELSKAGEVLDRDGLTRAGRALDKHGNRPNSVFPQAKGNTWSKNAQGQEVLDSILTDPQSYASPNNFGGIDIIRADGSGARFYENGSFRGLLEPTK